MYSAECPKGRQNRKKEKAADVLGTHDYLKKDNMKVVGLE